jgi:hypothetical protein
MNMRPIKKWVAALRSGEFKQTRAVLRDDVGYCCLGVLCEIYRRETSQGEWKEEDGLSSTYSFGTGPGNIRVSLPPIPVREWIGIDAELISRLAELNDKKRMGFPEIADFIETQINERVIHISSIDIVTVGIG